MANVCKCCTHPNRAAIDAAIIEGHESNRAIAARFGVKRDSVARHKIHAEELQRQSHLGMLRNQLVEAQARADRIDATAVPAAAAIARLEAAAAVDAARTPAPAPSPVSEHDAPQQSGVEEHPSAGEDPPPPAPPANLLSEAVERVSHPRDPLPTTSPAPAAPLPTDDEAARELRQAEDRARRTALGMYGVSSTIILTLGKVAAHYKGIAEKNPGAIDIKDMIGLARAAASMNTAAVENLEVAAELERKRKMGPDVTIHVNDRVEHRSLAEIAESIESDAKLIALARRRGIDLRQVAARTVDAEVVSKAAK